MNNKILYSLLYKMLRIRMVEEKIAELYPEQEMRCPTHLSIGEEATAVGVCENLKKEDIVMSNHRSHAHYLAKGGELKGLIAELYGKATGCSKGRGGSMHLIDKSVSFLGATPILGGTIPIAVGAAFGSVMQNRDNIAVAFFGDAAVEEGIFHESLNFASLKNLPVLFICENNLYSVQTPLSARQPKRDIYLLGKAHAIESYQENGNDIIKVYEATKKAVKKIKAGKGPVFLEFLTYRWREHCGPNYDFDIGYRTKAEVLKWKKRCPIAALKKQMLKDKIISNTQIERMVEEICDEIDEAVHFAKTSPFPNKSDLYQHIYSK
ncbi:MAG: thiamine pyrophosphate-dependent dehydrogenase E1 component subunit alpha [Nanoarchaeota archaeon]|nr:thiamine pyrophosphate-dependent dehydrogenase E1 component subunit alpha [Nanoarchaeota archaeon]MCG2717541.1 thiamine pyrophosphate-dependent dehydrogenase E1 component subunit alpha [Nanoarchaeota archaeon]